MNPTVSSLFAQVAPTLRFRFSRALSARYPRSYLCANGYQSNRIALTARGGPSRQNSIERRKSRGLEFAFSRLGGAGEILSTVRPPCADRRLEFPLERVQSRRAEVKCATNRMVVRQILDRSVFVPAVFRRKFRKTTQRTQLRIAAAVGFNFQQIATYFDCSQRGRTKDNRKDDLFVLIVSLGFYQEQVWLAHDLLEIR